MYGYNHCADLTGCYTVGWKHRRYDTTKHYNNRKDDSSRTCKDISVTRDLSPPWSFDQSQCWPQKRCPFLKPMVYHFNSQNVPEMLPWIHLVRWSSPQFSARFHCFAESSCFLQPQDVVAGKSMPEIYGCIFCFHLWSFIGDGLGFRDV